MEPERFEEALEAGDWAALDRWYDERATLSAGERRALAKALDRAGQEPFIDAMCGKAALKDAIEYGLKTAARTQALCPGDPEYVGQEAFYLVERIAAADEHGDPADAERALRLLDGVLASDPGREDWRRQRGRGAFELLRLRGSLSACDYQQAFEDFRAAGELDNWFSALLRLRRDPGTAPTFPGLWTDFLDHGRRRPIEWMDFTFRRWRNRDEWESCRLPDDLLATIERELLEALADLEPTLHIPAGRLNSVGHVLLAVAMKRSDRSLLEKSLRFYLQAVARDPELALNSVYAANVCRDLARRDGLDSDSGRRLMDQALALIRARRQPGARGILELAHCFSDLVLERAPRPDDPLLEEAARMNLDSIHHHGEHYFIGYRALAAIRLLQGRTDDSLDALDQGMRKLGHFLSSKELREDGALAALRGHPRFEALLDGAGKNPPWERRSESEK